MWKFALYSSVRDTNTSNRTQKNHAQSHPTSIATEIHPQKHQLQQQAHRHKHSTVSQHYSSLSAEDHRLRAVNYRHKDPQILQEIEQSEAPPSDAPASSSSTSNQSADDEEKAEEDGCLQQIRNFVLRKRKIRRTDSFLEKFAVGRKMANVMNSGLGNPEDWSLDKDEDKVNNHYRRSSYQRFKTSIIYPSSLAHYFWLVIISIAILYNMTMIIARLVFDQLRMDYWKIWLITDYICDSIYILDILVRFKTGYLSKQGLMERDSRKLAKHYISSSEFKFDVLSIIPTDLLYFAVGLNPAVRLNRLLRWQRLREFFDRTIRRTSYPNLFRILNLVLYILIIVHWNACFYYALSGLIGYGSDGWVYPNATTGELNTLSRKYVYSFYWSTLTLLTIGETPHPEKDVEYIFVVLDFLVGVLIFATIVGNVGSMITNMNHDRSVFTQKLDGVKRYLKIRKVNQSMERKVISWFDYLWTNRQTLDDDDVLITLPEKLRAEIAIHVHLETLKQIHLFKDCEPGLLVELVLKLKLQVFSPGDYICKKGDIGREMYIVKSGMLKVCGDDGSIYATLSNGNVFGEISILEIPGSKTGNRRMANVMSIGYSDCFVLSKSDLWSLLKDYPVARQKFYDRGRDLLALDNMLTDIDAVSDVSSYLSSPQDHTSSLMGVKMKNMEDNVENLERSLCDFVTLYGQEQEALKKKVEVLESLLSRLTPTAVQTVHNEVCSSPKRLFTPKLSHKRTAKVSANGGSRTLTQLSSVSGDVDSCTGRLSPKIPPHIPKKKPRGKSANRPFSDGIKLEDLDNGGPGPKSSKCKSQVNLAMQSEDDDVVRMDKL